MNPHNILSFPSIKSLAIFALLAPHFICLATAEPRPAPDGVKIESDVAYLAPDRKEKLDLYQPAVREAETLSPAVVIIHGGGWRGGDKAAEREFITGTTLAKAGYVCVSINYWIDETDRWPTNLQDCKNAVRWLRVNAKKLLIDPESIGVIGGSAGGHLALMVAYTAGNKEIDPTPFYPDVSDHVSACVNMYGISNLATHNACGQPNNKPNRGSNLIPESIEQAPEKWKLASPMTHIKSNNPPTLTLHGVGDTTVNIAQSKELNAALKAAGVESKLIMVMGANHAWPLKTNQFDFTEEVTKFFNKHL
ncbi:MAG: alpha/beta hydrolase, partial [Gloeobacteraceae cyanobacterium ES-bin-144]|nr:alpha/beta hydrolase [Verrucomicrobiales bacterium]